ncbi:hypothetical protein [Neolewinella persica]|uniref:hypothetical protein n=1 Tax=Neolewinella persica TaxID=70998 RepID=UPI00039B634A|nr:hypothetical protein [Neolewinella persica]
MKPTDRIHNYQREDALAQVNTVIGGHLILGTLALAGNNFQFADSPHAVYCLVTAVVVFAVNMMYAWDKFKVNWAIVFAYLLYTISEFVTYGFPASMLEFAGGYSKGAMLDGIMYIVPFVYTGVRFALVLPLVAVAWYAPKSSSPVSKDQ